MTRIHRRVRDAEAVLNPPHPERVCWGCDKYCPAADLACGNGSIRTPHPKELFGQEWLEWSKRTMAARQPCVERVCAVIDGLSQYWPAEPTAVGTRRRAIPR